MTITVIIPTFRRPKFLPYAIRSILCQTYNDFKLYIYDNASGDETEQVVREFTKTDQRVHYYCHTENIGMIKNYAFAISQVKTPFFCFLSDDDILLPSFFEATLKGFKSHPDIAFSATSTIIINSEKKQIITTPLEKWEKEGYFLPGEAVDYMIGRFPVPTSVLFSREILSHVEIDQENPLYWDCDFLMHIAAQFPFFISKNISALFRCHSHSYSNSREFEETKNGLNRLIERIKVNSKLNSTKKKSCEQFLIKELVGSSHHFLLHYFKKRNYEDLLTVGIFLKEQSAHNRNSSIIFNIVKISKKFPYFIDGLHLLAKKFYKIFRKETHSSHKYDDYVKLLITQEPK